MGWRDIISFVFLTILYDCRLVNGLVSFCCKLLLSVIMIMIIIIDRYCYTDDVLRYLHDIILQWWTFYKV